MFLVEWLDSPPSENSWEPRDNLLAAQDALAEFERGAPQAGGSRVFVTPGHLLTSFYSDLMVKFDDHLPSSPP